MNIRSHPTLLLCLLIPLLSGSLVAKGETITETFKNIKRLDIETVSGDCVVETGKGKQVTVKVDYDYPEDCFVPEFDEFSGALRVRERFRGHWSCNGYSEWTITVPKDIDIEYSSASGSFSIRGTEGDLSIESASGRIEIEDCKGQFELDNASGRIEITDASGDFEVDNASGRIRLSNVSGKFELDNASGNIDIKDASGRFHVDNASGDIEAVDITIEDDSEFDTASGDVLVVLAKSSAFDLELDAASGDVVLDYNGNPVTGYFEFTARKDRGRIVSPIKFDTEEEYEPGWGDGRHPVIYLRKTFTRGDKEPVILLSTSSGTAELKQ
ncbi:MAG: DUF4097 family beta strand repeat protein [Fidelibacterota bacterium]|nr:MAG: DUF4097 family beta strand repeat protein [Candidatus Neomarinimicrobiota bacterium]